MQVRRLCGAGRRRLSCRWWRIGCGDQCMGAPMYTPVVALQEGYKGVNSREEV